MDHEREGCLARLFVAVESHAPQTRCHEGNFRCFDGAPRRLSRIDFREFAARINPCTDGKPALAHRLLSSGMTGGTQCQTLPVNFPRAFVNPSEATVASRIVELPHYPKARRFAPKAASGYNEGCSGRQRTEKSSHLNRHGYLTGSEGPRNHTKWMSNGS